MNSYKSVVKENKLKKQCDLFVNLNESKQFKESTLPSKDVKVELSESPDFASGNHSNDSFKIKEEINYETCDEESQTSRLNSEVKVEIGEIYLKKECMEPSESPLNNDETLCNTHFTSESHSNGVVEVKQEIDMKYETCGEESGTSRLDSKVKIEIEENDLKKECMDEIDETWQDELLKPKIKDFENISVMLPEEAFIKEENMEILEDPLLEVVGGKSHEKQEHCKSIGENDSKSLQEKPAYNEKEEFICADCGKVLSCKSEFDTHMLIHSKRQTHTGTKSHKCDVYGKLFNQYNLKIHMMKHTGEKPLKCNICGKFFSRNYDLNRHMLSHTNEKPHKCDICGKLFTLDVNLKRHMLIHTGEKSYSCIICRKLFNKKQQLNLHMLIHSSNEPHKCDKCGNFFNQKRDLIRHLLTHSGEKPHKCDTCGKSYQREEKLKSHILEHTSGKSDK